MIIIVDYGMGNLHSVLKGFRRIGVDASISSDKSVIEKADKLILPGVGHFGKGMENLDKLDLIDVLNKKVIVEKTPILGICLGMQLLTKESEEGNCEGLGWLDCKTKKMKFSENIKIPHIGWNNLNFEKENILLKNVDESAPFYFVHSYQLDCLEKNFAFGKTNYGGNFVSFVNRKNIFGVQFHPEKSHGAGLQILKNFARIKNV